MQDFDTDVVIVGAGPTGLMLAGELRLAGIRTVVLERLTEPMKQSRALGFSARTIEEFGQRGLLPQFGDMGVIPFGHFGGLPLDYTIVPGGNFGVRGVPQAFTEAVLARWATGLGAEVRRGWELTGLTAEDDGAEAEFATQDGPRRLRAAYVVGCDGARSAVRTLAGIDFPGYDATIEMLMADVADSGLRLRPTGELGATGMVVVLPVGPNATRVVVFERGAGVRPSTEPPTFDEVADALQRVTGEDIHGATPLWISYFTDASRQAGEYRRGRVFLAGDAAHIHMPIGAQGISAGLGDAVNLGWKLAAEIHGHAPSGLLDTYHTERHPVAARILANTLAQRTLYLGGDQMEPMRAVFAELLAYEEVQKLLVGMVTGLDIHYEVGEGDHRLLGRRLPDAELTGDFGTDGRASTFGFLHAGRGLVLDLSDDEKLRAAAEPWTDRVDVVTTASRPQGVLADVGAALVRPDGYIAWIGSGGSEAAGLQDALTRWFGRPDQGH
ncbi:FAD-dependent monooxygenase [Streptomyces sp. NPDC101151]|uniref:FAD-dependent monooxygenase n=1 Tax=Streptomyces sp. NPDC101151 TaxID=3366115 RepID=UPI003815CFB5